MTKRIYNHRKDPVDSRDIMYHLNTPMTSSVQLPAVVDLRTTPYIPAVYDQGELGSCTANATANLLRFALAREKKYVFNPSRLFIYYSTRALEGTVSQDSGCYVRDLMKELAVYSACDEGHWPYNISQFAVRPTPAAYNAANTHKSSFQYQSVIQNLAVIKAALFNQHPIILGIQVYESFESPAVTATGVVPLPNKNTESYLGGHCVGLFGYDDTRMAALAMNSWGTSWGEKGFFWLPYPYLTDPTLASDLWAITSYY